MSLRQYEREFVRITPNVQGFEDITGFAFGWVSAEEMGDDETEETLDVRADDGRWISFHPSDIKSIEIVRR